MKQRVIYCRLVIALAVMVLLTVTGVRAATAEPSAAGGQAKYVGSDACKLCHGKAFTQWATTPHSKLLTAQVEGKGCESCHGPGSLHVASTGKKKLPTAVPGDLKSFDSVCNSCHAASADSGIPAEWRKLDAAYWSRSAHSAKGVACLDCHTAHSASPKLLKQTAGDLCLKCHSAVMTDAGKPAAYTHAPVAQKQCLTCHNPHGTAQPQMVRPGLPGICVTCHKAGPDLNKQHGGYDVAAGNCAECHDAHSHDNTGSLLRKHRHGPFKSSNCESCHKPAGTTGAIALIKPEKDLCVTCHSKDLTSAQGAHKPVAEGMCTACHSPHVSDSEKGLLRTSNAADACFVCHSKVQSVIRDSQFKHKPVEDLNCTQCHDPHSSPQGNLLKKASIDLCEGCHKPHAHPFGKKPDGTEVKDPTTGKMLVCASCHAAHGSQWEHLTVDNYERELCVRCHKEGMHG